jgi:hypothetical protein
MRRKRPLPDLSGLFCHERRATVRSAGTAVGANNNTSGCDRAPASPPPELKKKRVISEKPARAALTFLLRKSQSYCNQKLAPMGGRPNRGTFESRSRGCSASGSKATRRDVLRRFCIFSGLHLVWRGREMNDTLPDLGRQGAGPFLCGPSKGIKARFAGHRERERSPPAASARRPYAGRCG